MCVCVCVCVCGIERVSESGESEWEREREELLSRSVERNKKERECLSLSGANSTVVNELIWNIKVGWFGQRTIVEIVEKIFKIQSNFKGF